MLPRVALVFLIACVACGNDAAEPPGARSPLGPVPAYDQRPGDATVGRRALFEEGYVGCGLPLTAYRRLFPDPAPEELRLDRGGPGADLPYDFTAFRTASGVDVATPNCLQCHAETLRGSLVIGLGNHTADFTQDFGFLAQAVGGYIETDAERAEWERWRDRIVTVSPYTQTATVGVNSADNLTAVLIAHRDRETLAWSAKPLLPLPPPIVVPVDVPPWWHMQKKNAMFYVAAGRRDHARIMMTASTLCVDTVAEARAIDSYFPDIRAFLMTLQPPAWPFAIDAARAAAGRNVFEQHCTRCHGSYGDAESYPNLVVGLDEVGTDPVLAEGTGQFGDVYINWYNESFFGELSLIAPSPGYIAPPLDGIWATAPYLHNGSVPTLRALLDSSSRPTFFARSYDTSDYDTEAVGWRYRVLPAGQDTPQQGVRANHIYDTTMLGYGNGGHPFADSLTAGERELLLEYLKTI